MQVALLPWRSPHKIPFVGIGLDQAGVPSIAALIHGHPASLEEAECKLKTVLKVRGV